MTGLEERNTFYKNICNKDIYVAIMQFVAEGINSYHNLTSTYLIANSVFVSVTILILSSYTNVIS